MDTAQSLLASLIAANRIPSGVTLQVISTTHSFTHFNAGRSTHLSITTTQGKVVRSCNNQSQESKNV